MSKEYYIQNSELWCGNSVMWWCPDGAGYTSNIDEAGVYTEEEALRIHEHRKSDKPWPVDVVKYAVSRHVLAGDLYRAAERAEDGAFREAIVEALKVAGHRDPGRDFTDQGLIAAIRDVALASVNYPLDES